MDIYTDAIYKVLDIKGETSVVEPILQYLSGNGVKINTVDISGLPWCEVNTQEERLLAMEMIDANKEMFSKYYL